MLKNIPTPDSLEQVSLRLYFTALDHVTTIISELIHIEDENDEVGYFRPDGTPIVVPDPWIINTHDFVTRAQPDLQLAYTLIQQSQEIALKAKICAVSPFLLLLGSDVRTWPKYDVDFTQFRTLDASDLIKVVNTVCSHVISEKFSQLYQLVRSGRNTISHLGGYNEPLSAKDLLDIMVTQYQELHQGRVWLRDRLHFQGQHRHNLFYSDHYHFNERTSVLIELATLFKVLTNKQYHILFGFSKKVRRYICHDCCYDASIEENDVSPVEVRTATLIKGKHTVFCHLCEKEYPVRRDRCLNDPCKSNVISDHDDWAGLCHMCGEDQKDFSDDDNGISPSEITVPP